MDVMIEAAAVSNVGNIRTNHEDNYLLGVERYIESAKQRKMADPQVSSYHQFYGKNGIFLVSDGMGGHSSGEIASLHTVKWINERYEKILRMGQRELLYAIEALNQYIYTYPEHDYRCKGMAATLSGLVIGYEGVFCINAGDSRTYALKDGKMVQLTDDHSEGQRLLRMQIFDKESLDSFPSKNALYKYIGMPDRCIADVRSVSAAKGQIFVICSDGVSNVLEEERICSVVDSEQPVQEMGRKLMQMALDRGEQCKDNLTVLLVRIL